MSRTVIELPAPSEQSPDQHHYHEAGYAMNTEPNTPPAPVAVRLSLIDDTPAKAGRAELSQDAIDDFAEHETEWTSGPKAAPVELYEHGGRYWAGDGSHRIAAKRKLGREEIMSTVIHCTSAEEAEREAFLCALSGRANAKHKAVMVTNNDKRARVRNALRRAEYESLSDRAIGELCGGVHHITVADERFKLTATGLLTGPASTTERQYKENARVRGGCTRTNGKVVANTTVQTVASEPVTEKRTNSSGGYLSTPPVPVPPPAAPEPPAQAKTAPVKPMLDARGRRVPDNLVSLFVAGRAAVVRYREAAKSFKELIATDAEEDWGVGLKPMMPNFESDLKKVTQDAASAVPWVCCPHIDATGVHHLGGKCKVCVGNRGWLSRHNWHQLADPIKQLIDEYAEPDAEKEPTPVEATAGRQATAPSLAAPTNSPKPHPLLAELLADGPLTEAELWEAWQSRGGTMGEVTAALKSIDPPRRDADGEWRNYLPTGAERSRPPAKGKSEATSHSAA